MSLELDIISQFVCDQNWAVELPWKELIIPGGCASWVHINRHLPIDGDNYNYNICVWHTGVVTIFYGQRIGDEFRGELSNPNFFDNLKEALDTLESTGTIDD